MSNKIDARLIKIAQQHLQVQTLATQRSDDLDFHDLAVWQIFSALKAAYLAGKEDTEDSWREIQGNHFSAQGCPLCVFEDGVFQKRCTPHQEIEEQMLEIKRLELELSVARDGS